MSARVPMSVATEVLVAALELASSKLKPDHQLVHPDFYAGAILGYLEKAGLQIVRKPDE